jgi:hypothetical protein
MIFLLLKPLWNWDVKLAGIESFQETSIPPHGRNWKVTPHPYPFRVLARRKKVLSVKRKLGKFF